MLTETERRQRGLTLASRVPTYLRERLERARDGRASGRQMLELQAAYQASVRAVRNLKRRRSEGGGR